MKPLKTKLYASSAELPMNKFIDVACDDNKQSLIKTLGIIKPKQEELNSAWDGIYGEFQDMQDSEGQKAFIMLMQKRLILANEISVATASYYGLGAKYNNKLCDNLKMLGFRGRFSKDSYISDLEKAERKIKAMVIELEGVNRMLIPYLSGEGMSREGFAELFIILSKFQGYNIQDDISVLKFSLILKNYKECQAATAKK